MNKTIDRDKLTRWLREEEELRRSHIEDVPDAWVDNHRGQMSMLNDIVGRIENGDFDESETTQSAIVPDELRKENDELKRQLAEIRTIDAKEYLEW